MPTADAHTDEHLLCDRWVHPISGGGLEFHQEVLGISGVCMEKLKLIPHLTPNPQISLRSIKHLKGKGKNISILEENVGENHYDFRVGKMFLNKKKLVFDCIKIK